MARKLAVFDDGKLGGIPFPAIPSPIGMPYDYDTGSAGDPGSGEFRFDGSYVYFDDVSAGAVNVETWLATMNAAGALYFCADLEPTQQVGGWVTTGPAQDMTGYWRIPVSGPFGYALVSGDAFARYRFNFVKYGIDGDPGAAGTPGANSALVRSRSASSTSKVTATQSNPMTPSASLPTNTQGVEVITLAYTPKAAGNYLEIEFTCFTGGGSVQTNSFALFVDSTANALCATCVVIGGSAYTNNICLRFRVAAGSTTSRTYKIRFGPNAGAGTAYVGRRDLESTYSTAPMSILSVKEFDESI
jgi:hypothetical protein